MPITKEQLDIFARLFRGNETHYGQFQDKPVKRIKTVEGVATEEQWLRHLKGEGPFLGSIPIRNDTKCYFGAIDVDDDHTDHASLAKRVVASGLPLVVCRSKSGGAHLYIFFRDPVAASELRVKLEAWASFFRFENDSGRPIEVFPKQSKLRPGQAGNWINLPYYGETRHAVSPNGEELTLDEFLAVAQAKMVAHGPALANISPNGHNPFVSGPPCLETLHYEGFIEGSRNAGLYNVGIFLKLASPSDWQHRLHEYNQKSGAVDPPLRGSEIDSIIRSLENKTYTYNCDEQPIEPHCKKRECKKRQYGITAVLGERSKEEFPDVSNLRKISTDPPRWILNLMGKDLELTTEELMSLVRMRRVALERANVVLPSLRPADWDDMLRDLLDTMEVIEAPEDAGVFGQFSMLVSQFTSRRRSSESREDILAGLPFAEGDKIFFRSQDLMAFLQRKRFYAYSTSEIYTGLRRLEAGHQALRIKNSIIQCWFVPLPVEEVEMDPAVDKSDEPTF